MNVLGNVRIETIEHAADELSRYIAARRTAEAAKRASELEQELDAVRVQKATAQKSLNDVDADIAELTQELMGDVE